MSNDAHTYYVANVWRRLVTLLHSQALYSFNTYNIFSNSFIIFGTSANYFPSSVFSAGNKPRASCMLGRHWAELTAYLGTWHGEQFEFHGQALLLHRDLKNGLGTAVRGIHTAPPACEDIVKSHPLTYDPGSSPLLTQTELYCVLTPATSRMAIKHVCRVTPEGIVVTCMGTVPTKVLGV